MTVEEAKKRVLQGGEMTKEEALALSKAPLAALQAAAREIRLARAGNTFDFCAILNGKSGRCSEDCKFCAQSAHYPTNVETYPLLPEETMVQSALGMAARGVGRYAIVTSGRTIDEEETKKLCRVAAQICAQSRLSVCLSCGLLQEGQLRQLKEAGVSRIHNNLESSRRFFPSICTTHTYEEKIATIQAAQRVGLSVCSGGLFGLGETMEDRIDLALTLRTLGIQHVPLNLLSPIPHTPYENRKPLSPEEMARTVALFRFLLPDGFLRLAGGRGLLPKQGESCFWGGANAVITGDLLTTAGATVESDRAMVKRLGFEVVD